MKILWRGNRFTRLIVISSIFGSSVLGMQVPAGFLSDLASADFRNREVAQAEILKWARGRPQGAMSELWIQSQNSVDPEVRERCLMILRELVNDEYLKDGEGFIGISMLNEVTLVPGGAKVRHAIRVSQIVKGSAAESAGLKLNDLIVGLDGKIWTDGPAAEPFSLTIKSKKPGSKVVLQLLRDQKISEMKLVLGKRPVDANFMMMGDMGLDMDAAELEAREAYFQRWLATRKAP